MCLFIHIYTQIYKQNRSIWYAYTCSSSALLVLGSFFLSFFLIIFFPYQATNGIFHRTRTNNFTKQQTKGPYFSRLLFSVLLFVASVPDLRFSLLVYSSLFSPGCFLSLRLLSPQSILSAAARDISLQSGTNHMTPLI